MFAPQRVILKRLASRGFDAEESQKRIDAQMHSLSKANYADFVIWGGGQSRFLKVQIEQLSAQFL